MNAITANFETQADRAPWHLNVIGTLALVWGVLGVWRYLEFQTGTMDPTLVSTLQLTPFYDLPNPIMATWAICAWGGVAGAALLLVRSKWAVQAFTMSLLGLMATSFYQYVLAENPVSIYETPFNFAVWLVALCALLYTLRVQSEGVLR